MKTNRLKMNAVLAFMGLAAGLLAQAENDKRIHIKLDQNINGKEIKLDTSYVGLSEAEVNEQLIKLGVKDLPGNENETDNLTASAENGDAQKTRIIIVNHDNVDGNDLDIPENDSSIKKEVIIKKASGNGKANVMNVSVKITKVESLSNKEKVGFKSDVPSTARPFTELKIYPNPAEATLNLLYKQVGSDPAVINMYDAGGKNVYSETVTAAGERVCKSISLSSFEPGVYFVQLTQGGQTDIKKLVVK